MYEGKLGRPTRSSWCRCRHAGSTKLATRCSPSPAEVGGGSGLATSGDSLTPMSPDVQTRAARIVEAAEAAIGRLPMAVREGNLFGALGEPLFWICALDETLAAELGNAYKKWRDTKTEGQVLFGLRLARNRVAHGETVYTVTRSVARGGWGNAAWASGPWGGWVDIRWAPLATYPPPSDPGHLKTFQKQVPHYQAHVEGEALLPVLQRALAALRGHC